MDPTTPGNSSFDAGDVASAGHGTGTHRGDSGPTATAAAGDSSASALALDPQWYQLLFAQNVQPAWIYEPDTLAFLDVNEAALSRYGYSRAKFLSMTLRDIRPPEDVPALLDSVASLDFGRRVSGEWRHLRTDGEILYAEVASYDCSFHGRRARLAVVNDVTERHHAEEALKRTIQDYRGLFENAHDAILIFSVEAERVLDVNQRACEIYGYSRGEFLGMSIDALARDSSAARRRLRQTVERGATDHFDLVHLRKDGVEMFLEVNASAVSYRGQHAILSINRDVTERKLAEQRMRREEQRRRLHVDQTPLAVIEWDLKFRVTAWNPAAEKIFSWTRDEALGRHASFIIAPSAVAQVDDVWTQLLASRGGTRSTNENATKDGRTILCEWYNTPLVDDAGQVVAVASLVQDVTESDLTRRALEHAVAKYRTLAEAGPSIVYTAEPSGKTVYANRRWYEYSGMDPSTDDPERAFQQVVHPDDFDRVTRTWQEAAAAGEPCEYEVRLRGRDGVFRWFLTRSLPLRDESGRVIQRLGTVTDIDGLKRAEEALMSSEAKFRTVAEAVADVVSLHSPDGRFEYVSPAVRDVVGYEPHELVGTNPYESAIHPDDHERVRVQAHVPNLRGEATLIQWRWRRSDGTYLWVETSSKVIPGERGRPVQIVCATRDISVRKGTEDELRAQKEIFEAIFDNIPVPVDFFGSDGRILLVNKAWTEVLGYTLEEARSRDLMPEFYPNPADLARARTLIGRASGAWDDFRVRTGDGREREIMWANVRLSNGTIIGIGQDVTERRKQERLLEESQGRLRRHAEELNHLVQLRTQRIQELERQRGENEKLVATGRMAARIAHEINNPLAGISSGFRLLKSAVSNQHPHFEHVARVEGEIDRISRIIRKVFEAYRTETETPQRFSLSSIADDVCALLDEEARRRGVRLLRIPQPDGQAVQVMLWQDSVKQVLFNLVRNAIEASPDGGEVGVTVRDWSPDVQGAARVCIEVTDQGAGVPPELRSQIFEPFYTTKPRDRGLGLGLGLSVSNTLVVAMGGRIDLESPSAGEVGATFRVILPAQPVPTDAERTG